MKLYTNGRTMRKLYRIMNWHADLSGYTEVDEFEQCFRYTNCFNGKFQQNVFLTFQPNRLIALTFLN